jgi:hypothetical protein
MECPNCGGLLLEGARYCSNCGTRVREHHAYHGRIPQYVETQEPSNLMQTTGSSEQRFENARVGYRAALDIWRTQMELISSRFNAMIVANSIILALVILAVIGLAFTVNYPLSVFFTRALVLVGIVVSLAWLHIHSRASQHGTYFLWSARELESHLADPIVTISRGVIFSEGNEVAVMTNGEKKKLRLSWLARMTGAESSSYFVIVAFILLYIALLLRV